MGQAMDWRCWCGRDRLHATPDGRAWCNDHAPRCRSGAHFYGNCECTGCDCPVRGFGRGSRCLSERHGLKFASDDWCNCKCHDATETERLRSQLTTLTADRDALRAEVEALKEECNRLDSGLNRKRYRCLECGLFMSSYLEFEEFQHDGCGGLVVDVEEAIRLMVLREKQRDQALADRDRMARIADLARRVVSRGMHNRTPDRDTFLRNDIEILAKLAEAVDALAAGKKES